MPSSISSSLASRIKSAVVQKAETSTIRWGTVIGMEPMVVKLGSGEDITVSQACVAQVGDRVQVSIQGTKATAIATSTDRKGETVTTDNVSTIKGKLEFENSDGSKTIIQGGTDSTANMIHVLDTTPPGAPTGISAWSENGYLYVSWDGTLDGGIPSDFDHVNILVDGIPRAQMKNSGTVIFADIAVGLTVAVTATAEDDACLSDGTPAHNVSNPCTGIAVTIRDTLKETKATAGKHESQIDAIQKDIADYKKSATATYATKTEVDDKTGAITKTLTADYTKTADLGSTSAVKDAKKAGTDAQSALDTYKANVSETYAEKTELKQQVNLLKSTMTSNYTSFTDYRETNDTALSKAQSDATNAQSTIDSYKTSNDKAVADAKSAGTTAQNQLAGYKASNDAAVAAAKKAGTDAQANLDSYKGATDQRLDELKNIADNAIETFYLKGAPTTSNEPASTWTTDTLRKQHAGDLYMDTDTGYSYRWSGTEWVQVKDSDVTKALREIAGIKIDYATKSELTATDKELSGKVSDSLTTAKAYTDSSIEQEATARNAAIKAQADSISLEVSKTYTRSDTFAAYQSDADGRIATANSNASTAKSTAQTAASDAAKAKTNASTAVDTANAAKTTAQTASTSASNALSTANGASTTANAAKSAAASATSTANTAKSTAQTAKSTADTAKSTADSAKTAAGNAQTTANTAVTNAARAQSTADAASGTAKAAKSTADTAKSTADDAWARTLRIEVMSAPKDAAGDTSLLTAYAYRGGELLSDEAVAKMGLLAWYVGGKRVATGSTYACAAGTAAECRLEA